MRKVKFQNNEYYHIYNRGVDKRDVFMDDKDFIRFLKSIREFNCVEPIESIYRLNQLRGKESKALRFCKNRRALDSSTPLVEIISYCLNPNHYHFILKQLIKSGISKFMMKLSQGYTLYFNQKHNRSGSLFQGTFKSVHIKDTGYLSKLLIYVNYNYEIHELGKIEIWPWSSYPDIAGKRKGSLCNKGIIKEEIGNIEEFKKLATKIIPEIKENKNLQKYLLE